MNFYSQHGEDFLLHQIFGSQTNGFFVEVGCIDGRRFSNTLTFENRGWRGLCVEAHRDYIDLIRKNRPNSIVCHCAAAEVDDDDATFYANSRGSLSTLDHSKEEEFRASHGQYFTGFEKQPVRKRRLDTIFREHGIQKIDLLSIDIEGYEIPALRGIDFQQWKPAVMVIEASDQETDQLKSMLLPHGYHPVCHLANNVFYALDKRLQERFDGKLFSGVNVIHTRHPLDAGDDKTVVWDLDTSKGTVRLRVKPV